MKVFVIIIVLRFPVALGFLLGFRDHSGRNIITGNLISTRANRSNRRTGRRIVSLTRGASPRSPPRYSFSQLLRSKVLTHDDEIRRIDRLPPFRPKSVAVLPIG